MAIKNPTKSWLQFITRRYEELLNSQSIPFQELVPSKIPQVAGVYLITARKGRQEVTYYIGRTINLRRRLYTNHLMGPVANARLKRYLIGSGECRDIADAKRFIKDYCYVRWIEENNSRRRGAIEGYAIGLLFPKYELLHANGYTFLLIHDPEDEEVIKTVKERYDWIIHGHVHNNKMDRYPFINGEQKTINMSAELINYKPVKLSYLLSLGLDSIRRMRTIDSQPERW